MIILIRAVTALCSWMLPPMKKRHSQSVTPRGMTLSELIREMLTGKLLQFAQKEIPISPGIM